MIFKIEGPVTSDNHETKAGIFNRRTDLKLSWGLEIHHPKFTFFVCDGKDGLIPV